MTQKKVMKTVYEKNIETKTPSALNQHKNDSGDRKTASARQVKLFIFSIMGTTNVSYSKEVAETILQQLGGRRFVFMTGAHQFTFYVKDNGNTVLQFKIGKCNSIMNAVLIEYNSLDLYDMYFLQVGVKEDLTPFSKTIQSY